MLAVMRARTVGVLVVVVAAIGCGGRVSYDEPWAEAPDGVHAGHGSMPVIGSGYGGDGGEGGGDGGDDTSTATLTPTSSDTVTAAPIAECATAAKCDDGNPCTLDYCMPNGCYNPEDTKMTACGDAGHCFKSQCCEGCIDGQSGSCVVECPAGQTCSAQGMCA